jgi:branched-chain amino acid transport system ATP-binding protein
VVDVSTPVLDLEHVTVQFGGLKACDDVTFRITEGELFAMIGPNGAGKTTVVNAITGVYAPNPGATIQFTDAGGKRHDLLGKKPHQVVSHGIARTFQNLALFDALTVLENLMLGRYVHSRVGIMSGGLFLGRAVKDELRQREVVERIIDLLEIAAHRNEPVGDLPYGVRKRLELGRALAQEPHLLLLDEPMTGQNLEEKQDMVRFIADVRAELGTTMLLIEHDMGVVMSIAERVMVLNFGKMIGIGTPEEIQQNSEVIEAYLGIGAEAG